MKRLTIVLFIALLMQCCQPAPISAAGSASIVFSPTTKTVSVGESFNISLVVNPAGATIDTVRALVSFPADLLEATGFSLSSAWPNASPGGSMDNTNGVLSQGGFSLTGGTGQSATFGTITFKAKSAGKATVGLISGTRLIQDGAEQISDTGLGKAVITIIEKKAAEPGVSSEQVPTGAETGWLILTSPSHPNPDVWYPNDQIDFEWAGVSGVKNYYFKLDKDPQTNPIDEDPDRDPDEWIDGSLLKKTFSQIEDGIWYLHLVANLGDKYSNIVHYKVLVDATKPNIIFPYIDHCEFVQGQDKNIFFGTTDNASGIDHYTMSIDGADFQTVQSPYSLSNFAPGEYRVVVRAYDRAENYSEGSIEFEVLRPDGTRARGNICILVGTWELCDWYLLIGSLVLVLLVALLLYLLQRFVQTRGRKKRK